MDEGYQTTMGGYEPPEDMRTERPVDPPTGQMVASERAMTEPSRPAGRSAMVGLLMMLVGAWGGAVAYFGPDLGIGPQGGSTGAWTTPHAVLSLAPGAAAVLGGLMVLFGSRFLAGAMQRLGALLAFGAGGWFVLGAVIYPVFYGAAAPGYLQTGRGPLMNLASVAAYGPGVGIALCALSGMAMAWSAARVLHARRMAPAGLRRPERDAPSSLPLRNTNPVGI